MRFFSFLRVVMALALIPVVLGLFAGVAAADEPKPTGSPVLSDPVFLAHRLDGTTAAGRIKQLGPQGTVVLVPPDGPEVTIPIRQLFKLTRERFAPSTIVEGSLVLFPEGDRLRSVVGAANETALDVQSYALGNLSIPLDHLLGLVLTPPPDADDLDALLNRIRTEPRSTEVLWLSNGDRLTGGFLGIDERKVKFQGETNPVELDRASVVALAFDPSLVAYPRPEGDFLDLTLTDGSRLGVKMPKIERGHVVATTRFGVEVRLAIGELAAVHARTPSVEYLSDREASAKQYVTYLGPQRPYRRDATVDGHPFHLSGQVYDRGIGTQSRTLLAYRVSPGDRRFQATVGLDDHAGPLGSVVFRVLVDGKERFASPPLSVRDQPRVIDVDLTGAKVLVLSTEFGERGEVRDFADWIEARLIR